MLIINWYYSSIITLGMESWVRIALWDKIFRTVCSAVGYTWHFSIQKNIIRYYTTGNGKSRIAGCFKHSLSVRSNSLQTINNSYNTVHTSPTRFWEIYICVFSVCHPSNELRAVNGGVILFIAVLFQLSSSFKPHHASR